MVIYKFCCCISGARSLSAGFGPFYNGECEYLVMVLAADLVISLWRGLLGNRCLGLYLESCLLHKVCGWGYVLVRMPLIKT